MEQLNPLEKLSLLEKKIATLVEVLKAEKELTAKLTEEKSLLMEENNQLLARLDAVEGSLLKGTQSMEELNQERMLTKMVVDELIKNIDQLVGQEKHE